MPQWYMQCRSSILILHALIGVGIFGYSLRRRQNFLLRALLSTAAAFAAAWFVQKTLYIPGVSVTAVMTKAVVSLINYGLALLVCRFCLDESYWTCMYVTTAGMAVQGVGGCIKSIVKLIPFMNGLAHHDLGILPLDLLCYGGCFALVFLLFRPYTRNREEMTASRMKTLFSAGMLLFYMANTWLIQDYSGGTSRSYVLVTNAYAIMFQILVFVVQFNVLERDRMTAHMETLRELMHEQRMQYETSRESVQLINEKYHDLKSLLGSIQHVVPAQELEKLKESIERYDVRVNTGLEVLDVVLTEKMNLCLQRGITMTCHIGQADLSFLEELDLYTLFNNALTNAINAVSGLPEGQARYIVLTASQENNFVSIHVENPCFETLEFVNGLPKTAGDPAWHGFGMKSMERTAEKYGGALSASHKRGCFQLDILLLDLTGEASA